MRRCSASFCGSADFSLGEGLRDDLEGVVVAPGLVLGRLAVLLGEGLDVFLGGGRIDEVVPDQRPDAREIALARAPGHGRVEAEAGDRELQPVLGILLDEVGDLVAGEFDATTSGRACRIFRR